MGELTQFNKYIDKDVTAEDALGTCCLDGRCKKKDDVK